MEEILCNGGLLRIKIKSIYEKLVSGGVDCFLST